MRYNQEHLFGSDEFVDKIKDQADRFITEIKKHESFENARFAKVDVYKCDCEARFYWGVGESSKFIVLVLGNDPAVKLQRNKNIEYCDKNIIALKEVVKDFGWRFVDGES